MKLRYRFDESKEYTQRDFLRILNMILEEIEMFLTQLESE